MFFISYVKKDSDLFATLVVLGLKIRNIHSEFKSESGIEDGRDLFATAVVLESKIRNSLPLLFF